VVIAEENFMPGPAAILRELHRLHRHAEDLRTQINRGPQTIKAHQDKTAKLEELLHQAQESIKKIKVNLHEKEGNLKSQLQVVAKHEKQLNEVSSRKEYDALRVEIESDRKVCSKIEDEILEVMGEIETRTVQIPEYEKSAKKAKEDMARVINDIQTRRNELTDRLNETLKSIHEVEAGLPEDVRALYDRLVSAKGDSAMSSVQGRTCSACYTEITAQNQNDLVQERLVLCKNCGRILYIPEGT
jgi:predicted  nucleic acid-binding Zn-ribbon protein